jgi:hypothetical protein
MQPSARRKWVVSTMLQQLYPQQRTINHCTGVWVGRGAGLDGMKNLTATGIRSPDLPAHWKLLYQLRYSIHQILQYTQLKLYHLSRTVKLDLSDWEKKVG